MVAQRSLDGPGPDPDYHGPDYDDPPESLLRTGDAAALVPVAERDGSGVRLRRRSRFVEAARPRRPGRHVGSRPAPRADPRTGQSLSRIAGLLLAIVVVAGLVFTVVRSQGDSSQTPVFGPAAPAGAAAAAAAETPEATPIPAPAVADPSVTLDRPITLFPDDLIAPAPPVGGPDGAAAGSTAAVAGVPAGDPAGDAGAGTEPVTVSPAAAPPPLLFDDVLAAPGSARAVEPFAGYELPAALQDWPGTVAYVVQPGDLLGSLALNNRTTSAAIAGVNNLTDASHLRAGETLLIPVGYVDPVALPAVDPVAALLGWHRLSDYTVRPGDSLAAIAALLFTSEGAIVLLNDLQPGVAPVTGDALVVPWGFTLDVSESAASRKP